MKIAIFKVLLLLQKLTSLSIILCTALKNMSFKIWEKLATPNPANLYI